MFAGLGSNITGSGVVGANTLFCVMPFVLWRYEIKCVREISGCEMERRDERGIWDG
jgi:hypothetical protein